MLICPTLLNRLVMAARADSRIFEASSLIKVKNVVGNIRYMPSPEKDRREAVFMQKPLERWNLKSRFTVSATERYVSSSAFSSCFPALMLRWRSVCSKYVIRSRRRVLRRLQRSRSANEASWLPYLSISISAVEVCLHWIAVLASRCIRHEADH